MRDMPSLAIRIVNVSQSLSPYLILEHGETLALEVSA